MIYPKGDPENPMTWDDTTRKFLGMTAPLGRNQQAAKVADMVRHLEQHRGVALVSAIADVVPPEHRLN